MAANRSLGRDIVIYLATNPTVSIGGGFTNPTFTKTTFLDALDVLITHDLPLRVCKINDDRVQIQRNQDPLLPGEYEVESDGHIEVTDAPYYKRTTSAMSSLSASGRVRSFPAAVRDRDRRCVITGIQVSQREPLLRRWTIYDAAHIFSVALESFFHNYNFGELVVLDERDGSVSSPQNGLLLQKNVHALFDQYEISINPNDDYRIVCFFDDILGLAGRQLDPICRDINHPHHVNDNILFWHFQQAVLANMRGAGEPIFDEDIPPGSDTMDAILSSPAPAERMEFELSGRLGDVMRAQGSLLIK
ncbi:HNH endonuclease-domain-containing protein [Lipomyces doorenjongii]|uniref:HNH endonuclease-domain-containing protein n=1 Tax=Lipomyces doorenjongii TaxID=383834 RepID=UPI0034CD10B9